MRIRWAEKPERHDYAAAESYLNLVMPAPVAKRAVAGLKRAKVAEFKSKDIFRASALPLLPLRNAHVKLDEKKILARRKLSPILLVRDDRRGRVIIADGYHRLCAVYAFDEDAVIPCKIV
jgi:hypothetical protein